jgi:hypothetical protein
MKMENTIAAPYAGTVSSVLVGVNTQVEAGAPLVRLQAPDHAEPDPVSAPIDLAELAGTTLPSGSRPAGTARVGNLGQDGHAQLRAYLLGYDLSDDEAHELSRQRGAMLAALPPAHPAVLGTEQELLEIFADIAALSRRVPEEDAGEEHARSSQEYLLTYLSFLDPERSGAPGHFLKQLRAALARYGVHTLKRTPELERALLRVYRSVSRMPAAAPIVIAILDSWRRAGDELAPAMTGDRLAVLDRLIQTTQGRQQEVCDLAREVRFQYVDAPLLKASRAQAYAGIAACVSELSGRLSPQRRRELTDRLIWFPLPMRALLRDSYRAADTATRARLLEVRTRRYYRIRELTGLRCQAASLHTWSALTSHWRNCQPSPKEWHGTCAASRPDGRLSWTSTRGAASRSAPGGTWPANWPACSPMPGSAVTSIASTSR